MNEEDHLPERKSDLLHPEISKKKLPDFLAIRQYNEPAQSMSNYSVWESSKNMTSRRQSLGLGPPAAVSPFFEDIRLASRKNTFVPVASDQRLVKFTQENTADPFPKKAQFGHSLEGKMPELRRGRDMKNDLFFRKDIFNPRFGNPTDGASCLS
jgi:hypothetical protein